MEHNRKAGIYRITNTVNGKVYIGQSVNVERRMNGHKLSFRAGRHRNKRFQRAWDKYGEGAFVFERVLSVLVSDTDVLTPYEQRLMNEYPRKQQYNLAPLAGGSNLGITRSEEAIEKNKAAASALYSNPEYRAMHAARIQKSSTDPEWLDKMANLHADPEWRRKRSEKAKRFDDPSKVAQYTRRGARVTVDGVSTDHQSVKRAFIEKGLPVGVHQPFRIKLKESGCETFTHDGKDYLFELID